MIEDELDILQPYRESLSLNFLLNPSFSKKELLLLKR
jgi:hypothetical protein